MQQQCYVRMTRLLFRPPQRYRQRCDCRRKRSCVARDDDRLPTPWRSLVVAELRIDGSRLRARGRRLYSRAITDSIPRLSRKLLW